MGLFICKYHGDPGIVFVCSHISKDIDDRRATDKIIKMTFPDDVPMEEKFRFDLVLNYCPVCAGNCNFPTVDAVLPLSMKKEIYDNKIFPACCWRCFKELNC